MQMRVSFGASLEDLAGGLVDARVTGLVAEQRGDDFAVSVEHPGQIGMGPRARPVRIHQSKFAILRVVLADESPDEVPDDRMREFGFNLSGAAIDREKSVERGPHEHRVVTSPTTAGEVLFGNKFGEFEHGRIPKGSPRPARVWEPPSRS